MERTRFLALCALIPALIFGGGWLGSRFLKSQAGVDGKVGLAEKLLQQNGDAETSGLPTPDQLALARAQREREEIFSELKKQADDIRLSHPDYMLQCWGRQYGEIDTRKLAEWNNKPPETILRVEQSVISTAEFLAKMEEAGIELVLHPFSNREQFYILPRGLSVRKLPGYEAGWFTVQDPATSVSVDLLRPVPGETILDACAAPGGKTAMIASRMKGEGSLVAMDVHDDRIEVLKENMDRMNLDWVELVKGDAREPLKALGDRAPIAPVKSVLAQRRHAAIAVTVALDIVKQFAGLAI